MIGWYAVFTKSRQEQRARDNLQRQGFRCHLPLVEQRRGSAGRRAMTVGPLFPRYLFIRLDPQRHNVAPVRSTQGVSGLVRFGDHLPVVPDEFINELLHLQQQHNGPIPLREPDFHKGDRLVIEDGPLIGFDAIFQERRGEGRVMVLMRLLGGQQRVVIEESRLTRAA